MEAMESVLPCIVSKNRGNVDSIEKVIGGYFMRPMCDEASYEKVRCLARHYNIRKRILYIGEAKTNSFSQNVVVEQLKYSYDIIFTVLILR